MLRIACAVALLAACSQPPGPAVTPQPPSDDTPPEPAEPAQPEEPPEPAKAPLVGDYTSTHTVMVVCDKPDWCEQEVTDRLSIAKTGDDIEVEIELVGANAHTCTFEHKLTSGTGTPQHWTYESADGDDGHPCKVKLTAGPTELELTSEGCRYYCGARAVLEANFPYN